MQDLIQLTNPEIAMQSQEITLRDIADIYIQYKKNIGEPVKSEKYVHKNLIRDFNNMVKTLTPESLKVVIHDHRDFKTKAGNTYKTIVMDLKTYKMFVKYKRWDISKDRTKTNLLYVITDGTYNKIGVTSPKNMNVRLRTLQGGNARKLKCIFSVESSNATTYEKRLHKYFRQDREEGEWFSTSSKAIIEKIKSMVDEKQLTPKKKNTS